MQPEDYLQGTASEASSPKKPLIKASSSKKALALAERPRAPPAVESSYQLLPLSGFSLAHLKQYAVNMAAYLRAKPTVRLADVCGTVALRRSRFPFRKAFVASSTEDLASQLETFAASGSADAIGEARTLRTAFILTGQGSQWAKNGVELMDSFPIYRKAAEVSCHIHCYLTRHSLLLPAVAASRIGALILDSRVACFVCVSVSADDRQAVHRPRRLVAARQDQHPEHGRHA